jgi:DNA sulfur modification protein DndC
LHEIRKLWRQDPNEPDWADTLPRIYREVFGEDLEGTETDGGAFTQVDAEVLAEVELANGVPAALLMKLIELELSLDGLSRRSSIFERIDQLLKGDWGTYEDLIARKQASKLKTDALSEESTYFDALYADLESQKIDAP